MPPDPVLIQSHLARGDALQADGKLEAALACWQGLLDLIEGSDALLSDPLLRLAATVHGRIAVLEASRDAPDRALGAATLAATHLARLQDISIADAGVLAALRCKIALLLLGMGRALAADAALSAADACLAALDSPAFPCPEIILHRTDVAALRIDLLTGLVRHGEARRLLLAARSRLTPLLGPGAAVETLTRAIDLADRRARLELLRGEDALARLAIDEAERFAERRQQIDPTRPAPDIGTAITRILLAARVLDAGMVQDAVEACLGGLHLAALAGGKVDWTAAAALSRAAAVALERIAGPAAALARVEMTLHRLQAIRDLGGGPAAGDDLDALVAIDLQRIDLLRDVGRGADARAARDAARRWILGRMAQGAPVGTVTLARLGL